MGSAWSVEHPKPVQYSEQKPKATTEIFFVLFSLKSV